MAKPKEFFDKVKDMFKGNKPKVTKQVRKQNKSDKEKDLKVRYCIF